MAQSKLYPVVMAGGSGSRLWPLSRVLYPKQFLCLKGDLTMLQTTICRLNGVECESPVVICNEQHRFIVAEQLRQLNKLTENIILEPAGRNTAPAIALAALAVYFFWKKPSSWLERWVFILIFSGGLGNLIDRVLNGYVVDFFATTFMNFAVFNVADCFVCVGAALFVIAVLRQELNAKKEQKAGTDENA